MRTIEQIALDLVRAKARYDGAPFVRAGMPEETAVSITIERQRAVQAVVNLESELSSAIRNEDKATHATLAAIDAWRDQIDHRADRADLDLSRGSES